MVLEVVLPIVDAISDTGDKVTGCGWRMPRNSSTLCGGSGQNGKSRRWFRSWGQRLYEVDKVKEPTAVEGHFRKAVPDDRERLIDWVRRFYTDIGVEEIDAEDIVDRRVPAEQIWLWDSAGPVSMAARTVPVEGVTRVQLVYTPPENRKRGYASVCVARLSKQIRDEGQRCILYTDLGNPVSNSVYRRIGYSAVAEAIQYRFE